LWQLLRNTGNWSNRAPNNASVARVWRYRNLFITIIIINRVDSSGLALKADDLNAYFAQVATDPHYSQNELENLCCSFSRDSDSASFSPFSDELFITVLGRVRSTSPGPEGIPFWLYKLCAVELGPVVAKLFLTSPLSDKKYHVLGEQQLLRKYLKLQLSRDQVTCALFLSRPYCHVPLKDL